MEIGIAIAFILIGLVLVRWNRKTAQIISVVYIFAIVYLAFISREPAPYLRYSVNIFGAARRGLEFGGGVLAGLIHGDVKVTNWSSLEGIILNILLFVPFGYLLPTLFPRLRWWQVVIFGAAASLIVEVLQLITRLGYADVDDLINNTIGAAVGVLMWNLFIKKHEKY